MFLLVASYGIKKELNLPTHYLGLIAYLPSLKNVGNNVYLHIDINATCQHFIDSKFNDLNDINKSIKYQNKFRVLTCP